LSRSWSDSTICDAIRRNASRLQGHPAIIERDSSGHRLEISYEELDRRANCVANGLLTLGVVKGDVVGLSSRNSTLALIAYYGVLRTGATFVAIDPSLTVREARNLANRVKPKAVIGEDWTLKSTCEFGNHAEFRLSLRDNSDIVSSSFTSVESFVTTESPIDPEISVSETDVALVVFTSGTEEMPKAVQIPHRNFMIATTPSWLIDSYILPSDRFLLLAPIYTMAGIGTPTNLLSVGATVVIMSGSGPDLVAKVIDEEKITNTSQTPTFYRRLVECGAFAKADFSSLRHCHLYGGQIQADVVQRIMEKNENLVWAVYWGQSELTQLGISGTFSSLEDIPHGDLRWIGRPMQALEIRVVDNLGRDSDEGELLCKSPGIMAGYLGDSEQTDRTISNGWLHTGDIVRVDNEMNVFFLDRKKEMIKTGGMNVSSAEVERVLREHPSVKDAAVIGLPDQDWSEVVAAFVQSVEGANVSEDSLRTHCKELLAPFKRPKIYRVIDELPLDDQGKVRKKELRKSVE